MEIDHEGKKYILKSQVESIIKERLSKVAQRSSDYEERVKELESTLERQQQQQASYDVLAQQVSDLKSQLESSNNRFTRYKAMSQHGITDQELIDVIEWQYERSTKDISRKERPSLEEWFSSHLNNPQDAPITLRPHIQSLNPEEPPQEAVETPTAAPETDLDSLEGLQHREFTQPPVVNKGAVPAPEGKDILRKAVEDPNFYNQNVDAIRQAWFAKYGRR